jgi:hypothetical protein
VPPVYEHCESNTCGAAEGGECIHGGANGATGVNDVVHKDYGAAIEVKREFRSVDLGRERTPVQVVPVHGDIEAACFLFGSLDLADQIRQAPGEGGAACRDAGKDEFLRGLFTLLNDLVGDSPQRAGDRNFIENNYRFVWHACPWRPHRAALKEIDIQSARNLARSHADFSEERILVGVGGGDADGIRGVKCSESVGRRMFWLGEPGRPPVGTMPDDPVEKSLLESNIVPHFLALEPLMPEDLFALREELPIQARVSDQV